PNDKTGYPTGVTTEHYIMPNQQLQYVIRFQNTGTDTAFTVVVRDTLNMNLDIFSVVPGVASHSYNFQMYGPR
ncbi:MAG: T9SS C-terminal target domain-containing protein, partial [Bacteroidetes bacterium CG_4_8_14_3_um_filter_31_14]